MLTPLEGWTRDLCTAPLAPGLCRDFPMPRLRTLGGGHVPHHCRIARADFPCFFAQVAIPSESLQDQLARESFKLSGSTIATRPYAECWTTVSSTFVNNSGMNLIWGSSI